MLEKKIMPPRTLSKSRLKLATECPTKLFYTGKEEEYADQSIEDTFLQALAEGGFQVGELAKAYHPGGHDIKTLNHEESLAQTNELLKQEEVTIFEAAVAYEDLFIRVDVLRKQGNVFDLVEVKAKSFDDVEEFTAKRSGKVSSEWFPYLIDVAFQEYVLRRAFPEAIIRPYLMLADKNACASVDGLNQYFKIRSKDGGKRTEAFMVGDCSRDALGDPVLIEVDVREYVKVLQAESYQIGGQVFNFEDYVGFLSEKYVADQKIPPQINCKECAACTFRTTSDDEAAGKKSGFKECWREALNFSDADFQTPSVMDIWNFRSKQEFLDSGRFFMRDLSESDFDTDKQTGARQWMQVQKTLAADLEPWIDVDGLRREMSQWTWPLHFIDFETSAVALPFTKGRRPYEVVAFQFSHHLAREDGRVEHTGEFINIEPGTFPNFEFVRALKAELSKDNGTIFRYAHHENTVLNQIIRQLEDSEEPDRAELIDWIRTITSDKKSRWVGSRAMVDLLELVKKHYYQIDMGGSNSIKQVLPSILRNSAHLQETYGSPGYKSRNFPDGMAWVVRDDCGQIKDPYKLLPPVIDGVSESEIEKVKTDGVVADGGAAMTAYAQLQFTDVPVFKREAIRQALLRYCELDTLAMVMIWQAWVAWIDNV